MADNVRYILDRMAMVLRSAQQAQIFSKKEVRSIAEKRSDFEYLLRRRVLKPADYYSYIKYEVALNQLREMRSKRLIGKNASNEKLNEIRSIRVSFLRHVAYVFERATRRFPDEIGIWFDYIGFLKENDSPANLNAVLGRALALYPKNAELWLSAAAHELEVNKNTHAARVILQRAIRSNKSNAVIWLRYFELELFNALKILSRRDKLGVMPSDSELEALVDGAPKVVFRHAMDALYPNVDAAIAFHRVGDSVASFLSAAFEREILVRYSIAPVAAVLDSRAASSSATSSPQMMAAKNTHFRKLCQYFVQCRASREIFHAGSMYGSAADKTKSIFSRDASEVIVSVAAAVEEAVSTLRNISILFFPSADTLYKNNSNNNYKKKKHAVGKGSSDSSCINKNSSQQGSSTNNTSIDSGLSEQERRVVLSTVLECSDELLQSCARVLGVLHTREYAAVAALRNGEITSSRKRKGRYSSSIAVASEEKRVAEPVLGAAPVAENSSSSTVKKRRKGMSGAAITRKEEEPAENEASVAVIAEPVNDGGVAETEKTGLERPLEKLRSALLTLGELILSAAGEHQLPHRQHQQQLLSASLHGATLMSARFHSQQQLIDPSMSEMRPLVMYTHWVSICCRCHQIAAGMGIDLYASRGEVSLSPGDDVFVVVEGKETISGISEMVFGSTVSECIGNLCSFLSSPSPGLKLQGSANIAGADKRYRYSALPSSLFKREFASGVLSSLAAVDIAAWAFSMQELLVFVLQSSSLRRSSMHGNEKTATAKHENDHDRDHHDAWATEADVQRICEVLCANAGLFAAAGLTEQPLPPIELEQRKMGDLVVVEGKREEVIASSAGDEGRKRKVVEVEIRTATDSEKDHNAGEEELTADIQAGRTKEGEVENKVNEDGEDEQTEEDEVEGEAEEGGEQEEKDLPPCVSLVNHAVKAMTTELRSPLLALKTLKNAIMATDAFAAKPRVYSSKFSKTSWSGSESIAENAGKVKKGIWGDRTAIAGSVQSIAVPYASAQSSAARGQFCLQLLQLVVDDSFFPSVDVFGPTAANAPPVAGEAADCPPYRVSLLRSIFAEVYTDAFAATASAACSAANSCHQAPLTVQTVEDKELEEERQAQILFAIRHALFLSCVEWVHKIKSENAHLFFSVDLTDFYEFAVDYEISYVNMVMNLVSDTVTSTAPAGRALGGKGVNGAGNVGSGTGRSVLGISLGATNPAKAYLQTAKKLLEAAIAATQRGNSTRTANGMSRKGAEGGAEQAVGATKTMDQIQGQWGQRQSGAHGKFVDMLCEIERRMGNFKAVGPLKWRAGSLNC